MKATLLAVIAFASTALAQYPNPNSDEFKRQLAASNYKAVSIYPASAQKGTVLNEWIASDVDNAKENNPSFFSNPDWPYQITLRAVAEIQAREWGEQFFKQAGDNLKEILTIMRSALYRRPTKAGQQRLKSLFGSVSRLDDWAKNAPQTAQMLATDRSSFITSVNTMIASYNSEYEQLSQKLAPIEEARHREDLALEQQAYQDNLSLLQLAQQAKAADQQTQLQQQQYWQQWQQNQALQQKLDNIQNELRRRNP